jgi:hypothetical protein
VGQEGAKVLRELGSRVKTMTKLSSSGILFEVHMAAEELQKKIDEKSYLLVNTERWDASKQAQGIKEVVNGTRAVETENKNKEILLHRINTFQRNAKAKLQSDNC